MECVSQLAEFLYTETTIPNALRSYASFLRTQTDDPTSMEHANGIVLYKRQITDRAFGDSLKIIFGRLAKVITNEMPETLFLLEGRQKSVVSTERKFCKLLSDGRSVETPTDTFAFRFIVLGKHDTQEAIDELYALANKIIQFFMQEGYPIIKVKDYVRYPKPNGYQSIHMVFWDPSTRYYFEVQIRTLEMHIRAVEGPANHTDYKKDNYNPLYIDSKKIKIPGFLVSSAGTVFDMIGIVKPIVLTHMVKTY